MTGRLTAELNTYLAQSEALATWLDALPDDAFARPSVLSGWDVRTLVGHVLLIQRGLERILGTTSNAKAMTAAQYVQAYRRDVDSIQAATTSTTGSLTGRELVAALRDVEGLRATAVDVADRAVLDGPRGPITALDWMITRTVDLVVHCDDLNRTFGDDLNRTFGDDLNRTFDREPLALLRPALATTTRALAEVLAAQAPGRSVEVRVPPFIAVQAVPGPRHTRGTPPNVVETDPLTWLRLATGRADFDAEVARGTLTANGSRSDLGPYLPLLS